MLELPTIMALVDCREEHLVKPGLKVIVKEPAALLLLMYKPGEEKVEGHVFKTNKVAKGIVEDLMD